MQKLWKLTSVVDCGTVGWQRRVLLSFQLSDIDVEPIDKTLPIYKQFAKTPYWWLITVWSELFNNMANRLQCEPTIESMCSKVWVMLDIEINITQYNWKDMYNVESFTLSSEPDTFERWVDTKAFILSEKTTEEEVKNLWFDAKHVKSSDEYIKLVLDSDVIF